jgi:hypothetical protein
MAPIADEKLSDNKAKSTVTSNKENITFAAPWNSRKCQSYKICSG